MVAVSQSGEYLGHCFGMDHHTGTMGKIMDDPNVTNLLSEKIKDMFECVSGSETSAVFEIYPAAMHKDGGVAFETLYLATNRNLSHSENIQVTIV